MPAIASSSAEDAASSSAGLAGVGRAAGTSLSAAAPASTDASLPVVGQRWRDKYDVTEALAAGPESQAWLGRSVEGGHPVVLRAFRPAEPEIRSHAWAKLGGIDSPHLQRARDALKAGEWRVEIADAPAGVPLHVWRAKQANVSAETVKTIVSHIAEALAALHAFELVHLGLRPEALYIVEAGGALTCLLGGLDALTTFDRKESLPAAVDPLYAPPEAVGLHVHLPGPGICAWDWWSLGRVAQELVLGHPIVAELAEPNLAPAALKSAAEELLMEADAKHPRAGAVEKMRALDPNLRVLLRGLLASAQDARWTGDNVDRWIRGQPVKEFYDTPRKVTHFRWRGRPYTVPEVAVLLQSAEHWAENNVQLFEPTTPGTLAHFLRWSPNQNLAQEQLVTAAELADALPLKMSTPAAQREAVILVALLQLSAGQLVWRGRVFDATVVPAMMTELGEAEALMVLRGLSTRSTAMQIERVDAAAGRFLTELGRIVGDVESLLKRHGWLNPADTAGIARLFRLALEPAPTLRAARDTLAQQFAGSDHPAMEKLFKAQNVGRGELVVVAWAAAAPEKFKFYSHAEAARRRVVALRTRAGEIIGALTWVQLERALQVGRLVQGGWGTFILAWLLVGLPALALWPGPRGAAFAAVPAFAALLYRMVTAPRVRRALRALVPEANWGWRDGPERCARELRLAGQGVSREALESELQNITREIAALGDVKPAPPPLPDLPRFGGVRLVGMLSWLVLLACVAVGGWRYQTHPVSAKELKAAWVPAKDAPNAQKTAAANKAAAAQAEEKEADVKISWPYKPTDAADKLPVRAVQAATAEQIAYATKHGRDLSAPYRPESITAPIVLPVPAGNDAAVMIFDGKRGELFNQQLYLLDFRPLSRTWVEVAGRKGVYLDQ